jgi:pyruvate-formate lyase-activating enzyme
VLVAVSDLIRTARTRWKRKRLESRARRTGDGFVCRVLTGESDYNLSVNSDMTVSCNCQDDAAAGVLGDLSSQPLDEIFRGPRAMAFRRTLASGRLPIPTCASCAELQPAVRSEAERGARDLELASRGIMVENTVACNLRCLACERARVVSSRRRTRLSLDDVRRVSGEIRRHGIGTLYFFKYGEPFLSPSVGEELRIIRGDNPLLRIVISTNGIPLDTDEKREGALLADVIYFSIDGTTDAMVRRYQCGGSFVKAYANMRDLVRWRDGKGRERPLIEWKYVVFNWNDRPDSARRAVELARQAGVDVISFWPTTVPYFGASWRYRWSPFWKTVGQPSWKGREVVLRA